MLSSFIMPFLSRLIYKTMFDKRGKTVYFILTKINSAIPCPERHNAS